MKEHFVIDPLISKRQQLLLATQLCRMVLKVCFTSVLYCVSLSAHFLSLPHWDLRATALPLSSLASRMQRIQMSGKWGSGHMQDYWHVTRVAQHCPGKLVYASCISHLHSLLHLRYCSCDANAEQVNNVIIAGNDENDF
jgi:hypothetical protein